MSHPPETTGPLHDVLAHQRSLASELKKSAPSGGVIVSLIRGFWAAVAALDRHRGHASAEENVDADPRAEAAARWLTSASQTPDHESGRRRYQTLIEGDLTSSSELEALREHAELCDRVARLLQAEFEDERYGPGRRVLRWLPAALTGLAVVLATYEMFREHIPGVGPWRGAYHSQPDFKGEPDIIRDHDIDFDWGRKSPAPEIPNDKISIRWDSCLTLDDDQTTAVQLVANDGARLYVDDQLVVDGWTKKTRKGAGAKKKAVSSIGCRAGPGPP